MRFQRLTIHNIASIEDAVIDFEAQPLADCEVFLITGKTGAGKSTILDAICLALYATTPRLKSTLMQGNTTDGEKTVKIDDPRQLMRQNAGEASATLTFIGSNEVHYEAQWAVARARKKPGGNMQSKTWQLCNMDTGVTLTKDKEIAEEIRNAIGLDFSQFCRTTMLAQGEFTRFLNSKDDEKAGILEKITGVDIYSKVGAKIFEITAGKRNEWEEAKHKVEGVHTLCEEEIGSRNAELSKLEKESNEIKQLHEKQSCKLVWIKQHLELIQLATQATEEHAKALAATETDVFRTKEALVRDWNATIDARNWQTETHRAMQTLTQLDQTMKELSSTYDTLLNGQAFAEGAKEAMMRQMESIDLFLKQEKPKAIIYDKAQTIVSNLSAIVAGRRNIAQISTTLERKLRPQAEQYKTALNEAERKANEAKTRTKQEEVEAHTQEEAVARLNLPALRKERDEVRDQIAHIHTAKDRIGQLAAEQKRMNESAAHMAALKDEISKKRQTAETLEPLLRDAKVKKDTCQEMLDKQRDTVNRFATTLRQRLHVGDICPVCRQTVTVDPPHEEELYALVKGLEDALKEACTAYDTLVDRKNKADIETRTLTISYDNQLKAFNEDKSVSEAMRKATEACMACGLSTAENGSLEALDTLEQKTTEAQKRLEDAIAQGEQKDKAAREQRKRADQLRKEAEALAALALRTQQGADENQTKIKTAEALIRTKQDEISATMEATRQLLEGLQHSGWESEPEIFAQRLTEAAGLYDRKQKERQTLWTQLREKEVYCQHIADTMAAIALQKPEWSERKATGSTRIADLQNRANDLNAKLTATLSMRQTTTEACQKSQDLLHRFMEENAWLTPERLADLSGCTPQTIRETMDFLTLAQNNALTKKTLMDAATKRLEEHTQAKPHFAEGDTQETLGQSIVEMEKTLADIGERKGAINQELKTDADNKRALGTLMADAEQKKEAYMKWARLNTLIGDATGNKFRKIAQSYVLASLIHAANSYMRTLTDRYLLRVTPGTFVITLEDAYQGFASRAASTISGGESFLVSLSLALALSDIGQRLAVDILFIDEGFGTLSGEPLQHAVSTLRTLHNKAGRHVGIISHVEELQHRIPVQIQLLQEGNNASSTVRIIPET